MLARTRWAVLAALSRAALWWALVFAPSPFVRVWIERGFGLTTQGIKREIETGAPLRSVELEFAPHGEEIPDRMEG